MYEIRALHGFSAPYMYDQRFLKIQKEREREREDMDRTLHNITRQLHSETQKVSTQMKFIMYQGFE
jgi:hypothetical protein